MSERKKAFMFRTRFWVRNTKYSIRGVPKSGRLFLTFFCVFCDAESRKRMRVTFTRVWWAFPELTGWSVGACRRRWCYRPSRSRDFWSGARMVTICAQFFVNQLPLPPSHPIHPCLSHPSFYFRPHAHSPSHTSTPKSHTNLLSFVFALRLTFEPLSFLPRSPSWPIHLPPTHL